MNTTTKTSLRILLGAAALAAVALTFATQPSQRAMASGPQGTGGLNGRSLDGLDKAAGCGTATEARVDDRATPQGTLLAAGGPNGTGGVNGRSLDGVAAE